MAGQVTYRPEMEDCVAASRAWWWRSAKKPRFRIQMIIALVIVIALSIAAAWFFDIRDVPFIVMMATGGFVSCMLVQLGLTYALLPSRARRLFRQQKSMDQELRLSWSDAGAKMEAPSGYNDTPWSDYFGWYESDDVFLLLFNDRLYQFAPKRALSAEQIADLRQTLRTGFAD